MIEDTLEWVLARINSDTLSAEAIEPRFHPSFLSEIPMTEVIRVMEDMRQSGASPWEMGPVAQLGDRHARAVFVSADGVGAWVEGVIEPNPPETPARIVGLLATPAKKKRSGDWKRPKRKL